MPDSDPAVVGVQSCGCVTLAHANPQQMGRGFEREIADIIRAGGSVVRTTVGEARAMPHFLPGKCPHDPPGWTSPEKCERCHGYGLIEGRDCGECNGTGWAAE